MPSAEAGRLQSRDWPGVFTPREVAGLLDIPPSTLRVHAARFSSLLSPGAGGGARVGGRGYGHRRYTAADVAILEKIKDLLDSGLSYDLVGAELGEPVLARRVVRRRQASAPPRRGRYQERKELQNVPTPIIVNEEPSSRCSEPAQVPMVDPEQIAQAIVDRLPRSNSAEIVASLKSLEHASVEQGIRLGELSRSVSRLGETLGEIVDFLASLENDRHEHSRPGWLRRLLGLG